MIVIEYVGLLGTPSKLNLNTSELKCGGFNQFLVNYQVNRNFSEKRPFYSPLPFDFMRTA